MTPTATSAHDAPFGPDLVLGTGLDGRALLENTGSGRSALLSAEAARLFRLVAGARDLDEAADRVTDRTGCSPERARTAVQALRSSLADARLVPAARDTGTRRRLARVLRVVPMTRLVRISPARLRRPAPRRLTPHATLVTLLTLLAIAPVAGVLLLSGPPADPGRLSLGTAVLLLPVLSLANALHEGSHALVCRLLGLEVQELGLALWWWLIPFWYVEHRGVPRLPARRDHALVALVGPGAHVLMAGVAAVLARLLTGPSGHLAGTVSHLLLVAALVNVNPALPTDGYRALEALTGQVGFRSAAIATGAAALLRVPRPGPTPRRSVRLLHGGYLLMCLGWGVVVALGVLRVLAESPIPLPTGSPLAR